MKGLIALDIDGTITHELTTISPKVVAYFETLIKQGWDLAFLTGRTLSFATSIIQNFSFPFYIALQNGADILQMPNKTLLSQKYLPSATFQIVEKIYRGRSEDYLIYAGFERGDFCYYRPDHCSARALEYFEVLKKLCSEPWQAIKDIHFAPHVRFPLIKCFGDIESMKSLNEILVKDPSIHASYIKDPVAPGAPLYLNLITDSAATKGKALKEILRSFPPSYPVIAAGDDRNDIPLFEQADIKVVMGSAPKEVLEKADIIAPSAKELGIIQGLSQAIDRLSRSR